MAGINPFKFINEVRAETSKVVWPTRREVVLTSVMVLILSTLAALFFMLVDWILRNGLDAFLSIAS